jgi:hypothetical protein
MAQAIEEEENQGFVRHQPQKAVSVYGMEILQPRSFQWAEEEGR